MYTFSWISDSRIYNIVTNNKFTNNNMFNLPQVMLLRFLLAETSDSAEVGLANADIAIKIVIKDNLVRKRIVLF